MYGVPKSQRRTLEILTAMGLDDKLDAYARTLSGGMRRRLLVAKALVHNPPVLVLDEPTAGVATPAVGSSSTKTGGLCTKALATKRRRRMPPDKVRA